MSLLLVPFVPLVLCWIPFLVGPRGHTTTAWSAGLVTLSAFGLLLTVHAPAVFAGDVELARLSWAPSLGLDLAFRMDGLAFLFCLLVLGIGLLVVLYARYYLSKAEHYARFYAFLLLFMGAMLGVVTSENMLGLVVFWELTSLSSFLLVGFKSDSADARRGARRALGVTGFGGLCLLGGVLVVGHITGSFELSDWIAHRELVVSHAWYPTGLVLILLGIFTKSAQMPFHFWLPGAMSAPTPASAYLHSATMVKAGVFLLARLWPVLGETDLWFFLVMPVGLTTMLVASYFALFQHDIKGLLAYSTISHLGLITALFGISAPLAVVAGILHIINHAAFKASLFMAAGIVDHEVGSRDMRKLGGLRKYMPITALLATVATGAMAGVPLLNGFLSKEMFFTETVGLSRLGELQWIAPTAAALGGLFSVAYSLRFVWDVFYAEPRHRPAHPPHAPPRLMELPLMVLVVPCILVGVLPALVVGGLLDVAAGSVLGPHMPDVHLALWHGVNVPLMMSIVAFTGGGLVFAWRKRLLDWHGDAIRVPRATIAYNQFFGRIIQMGRVITQELHNHSLARYILILLVVLLVVGGSPWFVDDPIPLVARQTTELEVAPVAFCLLLVFGSIATVVFHRRRLWALVFMGSAGLASALLFADYSAPDLALTQISVEFGTTVLILLALYYLPWRSPRESGPATRWLHAGVATACGAGVAALLFGVLTRPLESISDFYVATSLEHGGGTNIVNVILVDFRGFDTLGEITVLGIAALSITGLLAGFRAKRPSTDASGRPWCSDRHPHLLAMMARPLLSLVLLVAVFVFFRGHNLPGGGFIAALMTAVALILQFLAGGYDFARPRLRLDFYLMIAIGLGLGLLTGLGALVFDQPFLTSTFGHVHVPVVGEIELASAMAFDLGVYLTVIGVIMIIAIRLGRIGDSDAPVSVAPESVSPTQEGT
jgi:multicomponent K+:H+ antiporter subunit A